MIYVPRYFKLYEVLPDRMYHAFESYDVLCWNLFDYRILVTADKLRIRYGKMAANTWHWGGSHQYRGWRPWDIKVGALLSQHKWGRALDLIPLEAEVEEIRENIKKKPWDVDFKFITCIEDGVSWLHFDCRNWAKERSGLLVINP